MSEFRMRDAAISVGIGYVLYKMCRAIWGWPVLAMVVWGLISLGSWASGEDGWTAFVGFLAVPLLLCLMGALVLAASGSAIAAIGVLTVLVFAVNVIMDWRDCSIYVCYYTNPNWWNTIPTAHGWVHSLPPGVAALPGWHPHPGLFARGWAWITPHRWTAMAVVAYGAHTAYQRWLRYRRWHRWHPRLE